MSMTYTYGWMLIIYGFLGWCAEVVFAAKKSKKFVNRGFLNGPICPIYGFGMIFLFMASQPFTELPTAVRWLLAFVFSGVIASAVELLTGWALEKFFNKKWWDYSGRPFNLKGYICLEFSLLWGVAGAAATMLLGPAVKKLIDLSAGVTLLRLLWLLLIAALLADFVLTLAETFNITKKLRASEELERLLRGFSDGVGEGLYDIYTGIDERLADSRPELAEKKKELHEKLARYKHTVNSSNAIHNRLVKAFPNLADKERLGRLSELQAMYKRLIAEAKEKSDRRR